MPTTKLPPVEAIRRIVRYVPETGRFYWRKRPVEHFSDVAHQTAWNVKFAGKRAFCSERKGYFAGEFIHDGRRYRVGASRLAVYLMTGVEAESTDHINGDCRDDRIANLRPATNRQNQWNLGIRKRKTSGLPLGVFASEKKFESRINVLDKKIHLGTFGTVEEASAAYAAAILKYRGAEFHDRSGIAFSQPS
jgi:hypothetical protein